MKILRLLLVFVPLAFVAEFVFHSPLLIFACSAIGLIPLAGLLGEATEELAIHTGPKVGGLLNASLGNAAELIITLVALKAGKVELVKASLTGSILGNLLLILGLAVLVGGLKNGTQRFDRVAAGTAGTMMLLAVIGLMIPTFFEVVHRIQLRQDPLHEMPDPALDRLSIGVAILLILSYALSLVFTFRSPEQGIGHAVGVEQGPEEEKHQAMWSVKTSLLVLVGATVLIVFLSEFLVGTVEAVGHSLGLSELFLGIILIPLVGNVAEHLVAVQTAYKNKMELSMAISLGSSMQIALFVAPLLALVSLGFSKHMTLFFSPFEVIVLAAAVFIANQIALDGETNWLEGAQLLVVYTIAGLGFYWL